MNRTPPLPAAFRPLAWANLAAQSAEQISLAATPIIAVMVLGAGAGETGLLAAAQTLPFLLLAIPMGLLADRSSRKALMGLSEAIRAAALLALWLALASGQLTLALLAVLGFIGALGTVGFSIGAPAALPSLVARDQLAAANGRLELARSSAFVAGPALGGALVAWAGAPFAFAMAFALSLGACALLWHLPEVPRTVAPARHPLIELREGARHARRDKLLRPIILTAVVWNTSWFVLQAAYVPHAMKQLGMNASAVGTTLALYGVGMVVGAFVLAPAIMRRLPMGRAVVIGPLVSVPAALTMAATTLWPHPVLAALSFFLFGAGPIVWTISTGTLRAAIIPDALLGRVTALLITATAGARPMGAALGAWVGSQWSTSACLWLAAAGFTLQAAMVVASPLRTLLALPAKAPVPEGNASVQR